jgi:phosphate transport system substrate-binding protein
VNAVAARNEDSPDMLCPKGKLPPTCVPGDPLPLSLLRAATPLALGIVLLAATACTERQKVSAPEIIRVGGSTSMRPGLEALGRAFSVQSANIVVEISGGGSAEGLAALARGDVDLAAVSRSLDEAGLGTELVVTPVGSDGIAIIVHRRNPVRSLGMDELRRLFTGEVLDWSDLGGEAGLPVIVVREEGSGTRSEFERLVMSDSPTSSDAIVMPTTQSAVRYVAAHEAAVGYVAGGSVDATVTAVTIEGADATGESVRSGRYPLGRELHLVGKPDLAPAARRFLEFATSPDGAGILEEVLGGPAPDPTPQSRS